MRAVYRKNARPLAFSDFSVPGSEGVSRWTGLSLLCKCFRSFLERRERGERETDEKIEREGRSGKWIAERWVMGWVGFLQRVQTQTDQKKHVYYITVAFAEASVVIIRLLSTKNKSLLLLLLNVLHDLHRCTFMSKIRELGWEFSFKAACKI